MEGTQHPVSNVKNNLAIPIAIVLAGALVAGAIFVTNKKEAELAMRPQVQKTDVSVPAVVATEHVLGNPNAEIKIVEYSDLQCPFCADFHKTMSAVMDKYGKKGDVAWVYRHYWAPRKTQDGSIFHALAGEAAEASECVAELGGNDKFWSFVNNIFSNRNLQNDKLARLSDIASEAGVERGAFETCLKSNKYADKIQKEYDEAVGLGVNGTPTSFIMTPEGIYPVEGYVPFEELELILKDFL